MIERDGCCGGNGFIWDGVCERYMGENNIKVAEPAKTGQLLALLVLLALLALLVLSVIRHLREADYWVAVLEWKVMDHFKLSGW